MTKINLKRWRIFGCECMEITLPLIEADMIKGGDLQSIIDFNQGAYNQGVAASAKTHWLGGVADTVQCEARFRKYWKKWGVIDFERFPPLFPHHGHLIWVGCPHQHEQADAQERGAVKSGWNGLSGAASRYGEWGRVPDLTWQEAVEKYKPKPKPPPPPKEILGMGKPISWSYAGDQKLKRDEPVSAWLDEDHAVTIETGPAELVHVNATVGISGIKAGESVWFCLWTVYDHPTKATEERTSYRAMEITGNGRWQLSWTGKVPKSDRTGWETRLRLKLDSRADNAVVEFTTITGATSED